MHEQARVIWDALEFRTPAMLRIVEPLTQGELEWQPPNDANSIAWLLWHIAEVEDNWIRDKLLGLERRYPFGVSVKSPARPSWPSKDELLAYFHEARALSRERLERSTVQDFDRVIIDEHFGRITVRQLWSGVATSGAWHGGQIVYIANRLVPRPAAG